MLTLRMAWRNTWRNPRRTGIVVAAVAIGIAGTLVAMGVNYGLLIGMVETAISTQLGHVQIHAAGFDANPELEVRLADGAREGVVALGDLPDVRAWSRRVNGEGLISSPRASVGVRVVGVEPEREAEVTVIPDSVTVGRFLDGERRRVVIGEELARRLAVGVGDKVVLSVQDLTGDLAGEAMRVAGLFRTSSRALDRSAVFVRIDEGQRLLGLGDAVSEIVVLAGARERIPALRDELAARLPNTEVRSWEDLEPALVYLIDFAEQSAILVYGAIFIAMAFGIANVLLMTVYERTREIGILTAIGFSRGRLVASIVAEALFVTLLGLAIGYAVAGLSVYALRDGIDMSLFEEGLTAFGMGTRVIPVIRARDLLGPTWVAVVTALVAASWPAWRAVRLRPAEAVRHT